MKRMIDVVASSLALLLFSWLLVAAWIVSALETRSTGLFVQTRVGRGGQAFRLLKLRTMTTSGLGGSVTTEKDSRVTRFGRLLRAFKIDELPQLVNVLTGSMSLVGPRPTVSEDVHRMSAEQARRHDVRPGLTGLAQISGNTSLSWPERIKHDLRYVEEGNLLMDFQIIWRTILLFLRGDIESHPVGDDEWKQ